MKAWFLMPSAACPMPYQTTVCFGRRSEPSLGSFVFGTDGQGADALMVADGGARPETLALKPRKRKRWPSRLYMDGPELVKATLAVVPPMVDRILDNAGLSRDDVDFYLMHQATLYMIENLRARLHLDKDVVPVDLDHTSDLAHAHGSTLS